LVHVLCAVLGLGPAYAFPFMFKAKSSNREMKKALADVSRLEMFPKLFGTLAIVSGLVLFFIGDYGAFLQIWILGSLIVYVIIEIVIVGFMNPAVKTLSTALADSADESEPSARSLELYARVRNLHAWAGALSILIFALMVLKPH